jgi:hypothetical protein
MRVLHIDVAKYVGLHRGGYQARNSRIWHSLLNNLYLRVSLQTISKGWPLTISGFAKISCMIPGMFCAGEKKLFVRIPCLVAPPAVVIRLFVTVEIVW